VLVPLPEGAKKLGRQTDPAITASQALVSVAHFVSHGRFKQYDFNQESKPSNAGALATARSGKASSTISASGLVFGWLRRPRDL
jgi:hypothetical protein